MLRVIVVFQLAICFQAATISSFEFGGLDILRNVQQLFNNPILGLLSSVTQANDDLKTAIDSTTETGNQLDTTRKGLTAQLNQTIEQCSTLTEQQVTSWSSWFNYDPNDIDSCYNASLIMQRAYLMSIDATNFVLSTTNSFYLATEQYEMCAGNSTKRIPGCMTTYAGQMKDILVDTKPTAVNYELQLREYKNQFMVEIQICFGLKDKANADLKALLSNAENC